MFVVCNIYSMPAEILAKILLCGRPTKEMALVCRDWFMTVRRELFRRTTFRLSVRRAGISFLRGAVQPTISSLPGSTMANIISNICIKLPPQRLGQHWNTLWQLFGATLPLLTRLEEVTFYFRHEGKPMHTIIALVPRFPTSLRTVRLSPQQDETYDMVRM